MDIFRQLQCVSMCKCLTLTKGGKNIWSARSQSQSKIQMLREPVVCIAHITAPQKPPLVSSTTVFQKRTGRKGLGCDYYLVSCINLQAKIIYNFSGSNQNVLDWSYFLKLQHLFSFNLCCLEKSLCRLTLHDNCHHHCLDKKK